MSDVDNIIELKELLDNGIISKEEFEKLKKEILHSTHTNEEKINENKNVSVNNSELGDKEEISYNGYKNKNNWVEFWLCLFLGMFGAHKFYQKNNVMGILYLCTGGLFLFGWIIDLIKILIANKNKIMIIIAVVFFCFVFYVVKKIIIDRTNVDTTNNIILNAMDFYNADKSNTITQEELINLKGTPKKIEEIKWNENINLITLFYDNEEYNFYSNDNHLVWILIEKQLNVQNKSQLLKMFGLSKNMNTYELVTDTAINYYNCGIKAIHFWGIENNICETIKIDFKNII